MKARHRSITPPEFVQPVDCCHTKIETLVRPRADIGGCADPKDD
jgi:hypothetical protein